MTRDWLATTRAEAAAERILDAAGELFVDRGVSGVGMNEIATAAGCSRATVYRYFDHRRALHVAFVNREAHRVGLQIHARTKDISDPRARLVAAILTAVELVRSTPTLATWFEIGDADLASELAGSSVVIDAVSGAFLAHLGVSDDPRKARWIVRTILSLLTIPDADERALVEEFVVPVLMPRLPSAVE